MLANGKEPSGAVPKIRRACDCCRARKTRCDSHNPCENCQRAKSRCIYRVAEKKGPKRRRLQEAATADAGQTATNHQEQENIYVNDTSVQQLPQGNSISCFETSSLLSVVIIRSCLDAFFNGKSTIMPILDRRDIFARLHHLRDSPERYGLITALCSVIVAQRDILSPFPAFKTLEDSLKCGSQSPVEFLISETHRARSFCNYVENPSLDSLQTSFFLFAVFFCLGKDNSAWFYLRESITMLQLLNLHEDTTYATMADSQYAIYCRRTFWLLFITERAYALQRHRPLTLMPSICLPTFDLAEATILPGFLDLVTLFQKFDNKFISFWNRPSLSPLSVQPVVQLQQFLKDAIPKVSERTEIQQADLLISRQWLKTIVWQLCVSRRLLSSNTTVEAMSFHFPVVIAREVILILRLLPFQAFQTHGVGIMEKIFDIGCSLADVLLAHPNVLQASTFEIGPKDYLMEFVRILDMGIIGSSKYVRLLAARADECLGVRMRGNLYLSNGDADSHSIGEIDWEDNAENEDIM